MCAVSGAVRECVMMSCPSVCSCALIVVSRQLVEL